MATLHRSAEALTLVTLPVFLFQQGPQLPLINDLPFSHFQLGILTMSLFYLLPRVVHLAALRWVFPIIGRIGTHLSLALGLFFSALSLVLLSFLPQFPWFFFLLPFARAGWLLFYWLGHHLSFASEVKLSTLGKECGGLEFFVKLGAIISPLIGVFTTTLFGFQANFGLAIFFFVAAAVCALNLPALHTKQYWRWQDFHKFLRSPLQRVHALAIAGYIWEAVGISIFWPLFLALTFQNLKMAGYVLSAAGFLSLIFTLLSGWVFDHRNKTNAFARLSGSVLALLWLPRTLAQTTPLALVFIDATDYIAGGIFTTLFSSSLIWKARQATIVRYYGNYETTISLALIALLSGVILLVLTTWSWTALFLSFMLAGFLSLTFGFSRRE